MSNPTRLFPLVVAIATGLILSSCAKEKSTNADLRSGPTLEKREDGRFYEVGESTPFTGRQLGLKSGTRELLHECEHLDGQRHGWERRWFKDNPSQMHKQSLWVQDERVFYWEWWPNGNLKTISSQRDGADVGRESITYGSLVNFFEDGRVKFRAHYDEHFRWHGRVLDYNDEGELMWDAIFEHGEYASGKRPPGEAMEPAKQ